MKSIQIKFVFIFILTICFCLILSQSSFGSIYMSSVFNFRYHSYYNREILDVTFSFNNRINETANAYASMEYVTSGYHDKPGTLTCTAYLNYKLNPKTDSISVGYFNENPGNPYILSTGMNDLTSYCGIKYDHSVVNNLSFKMAYFPNELNNVDQYTSLQNRTLASAGLMELKFKNKWLDARVDGIKFSNFEPTSYIANVFYKPTEIIQPYIHYSSVQVPNYCPTSIPPAHQGIIGLMLLFPPADNPLLINLEYNWENDPVNYFGYRIVYPIAKNMALSYYRYFKTYDIQELRLTVIW